MGHFIPQGKKLNKIYFVALVASDMSDNERKNITPHAIRVTAEVVSKIQTALSDKGLNQSQLADKIGWNRSNISKLLKGGIGSVTAETADKINDVLGISINPIYFREGKVSSTVLELSEIAEQNLEIAALLEAVLHLAKPKIEPFLPQVDTKKLPKVGAAITRIVHEWEQGGDPHYSKIAVEVLDWLRKYYGKGMP